MQLYHGSPELFDAFDLSTAGEGSGLKFGYGVYLSEVITNAAHYSQPRSLEAEAPNHYLYTVEIPDLTEDNHITFTDPVAASIVERVEQELGVKAPEKVIADGKEFRKWIAMTLLGTKKNTFAGEKAAFVETADLPSNNQKTGNGDDIHFCRESLHVLGQRYFEKFLALTNR